MKRTFFSAVSEGLREFYVAPYRRTFARAAREEEDLFMMLAMSEALGVPNPATYYTCLLYTSPSPRDATLSRMPSSA